MVSDRCRLQWGAYVQARARDHGVLAAGDELNRSIVGVHMRESAYEEVHEHGGFEI